jgi:ATP-binding cassette subfamily A (ABC1) protein 1
MGSCNSESSSAFQIFDDDEADSDDDENDHSVQKPDAGNFEPVGPDLLQQEDQNRCLVIRRLRKTFSTPDGKNVAVKGLNLSMYEGQIFALLGHNGAGKTTTISMLCGLIPPTSGDAIVHGRSIRTEMAQIRASLGVCPQHDVLYPTLTVRQHLHIYGRLKGLEGPLLEKTVGEKITEVGLTEKADVQTTALSGGMKRKLSVAITLLADSKMVFMDEPTSGMDPFSRRSTWDIIQNNREGRVVVLTTHFMDEADLLGDRIGIMADGELRCAGSSLFLKNRFGAGYNLTIVKKADDVATAAGGARCDTRRVHEVVSRHVAACKLLSDVGAEMTFQLPVQASPNFPATSWTRRPAGHARARGVWHLRDNHGGGLHPRGARWRQRHGAGP